MELTNDEEKIIQAYRMGGDIYIYFFNNGKNKNHAETQLETLGLSTNKEFKLERNNRACIADDLTIERFEMTAYYDEPPQEGNPNDNSHESN